MEFSMDLELDGLNLPSVNKAPFAGKSHEV